MQGEEEEEEEEAGRAAANGDLPPESMDGEQISRAAPGGVDTRGGGE